MNKDYSVGEEYEISAAEFETVILKHFQVGAEQLRDNLRFDADKGSYIFRPRGMREQVLFVA